MTGTDVIVGEAQEIGTEVVRPAPPTVPTLAVMPQVKASELVDRLNVIRDAMNTAMKVDVDYGKVPGTDKPTLLKPGAEKLSVLFQLDVQLVNEKIWGLGDHLTVLSHATVFHAPSGLRLGYGEGLCTTRERKYAVRQSQRACPDCGAESIIKGKAEYGGGWLCWKKRGGCGAKFAAGNQAIEGQAVGDVENPDLPDMWNTALKMAEKRARVDAVLAVTGASALFTQDVEDMVSSEPAQPELVSDVPSTTRVEQTTIGDAKAAEILLNADSAGIDRVALAKAVGWALGRDLAEDFEDDAAAIAVLATLPEMERTMRWIEKRRAKPEPDAEPVA